MNGPGGVTPSSQVKTDMPVPKEPVPTPTEDLVPDTDDRLQGGEINLRSRQSHGSILHDQLLAKLKETEVPEVEPTPDLQAPGLDVSPDVEKNVPGDKMRLVDGTETVEKKQPPAPHEGVKAFRREAKTFFDALRDGKLDDAVKSLDKTNHVVQRLLSQGKLSELKRPDLKKLKDERDRMQTYWKDTKQFLKPEQYEKGLGSLKGIDSVVKHELETLGDKKILDRSILTPERRKYIESELGKITDPGTAYDRWKKLQSEDSGKFDAWKKGHDAYLKKGDQSFKQLEEKHKKEALKFVRGFYGAPDAVTDIGLSILDAKNILPRIGAFAQKIGVTLTVANGIVGYLDNENRKRFRRVQKERVESDKDSYRDVRNRLDRQQQIVRNEYRKLLEPHMKRLLEKESLKLDPKSKTPYTDRYELTHRTPTGPRWPR